MRAVELGMAVGDLPGLGKTLLRENPVAGRADKPAAPARELPQSDVIALLYRIVF